MRHVRCDIADSIILETLPQTEVPQKLSASVRGLVAAAALYAYAQYANITSKSTTDFSKKDQCYL